MRLRTRRADADIERLLHKGSPAAGEPVAAFVGAVRAAYLRFPRSDVEVRHITAIVESARIASVQPNDLTPRHRFRRAAGLAGRLAAVAGATALATAGLAVAGVGLPGPAVDAFEQAGIDLPNQGGTPGSKSVSDEVRQVIESTPPGDRGCEFGQAVSHAAHANRRGKGAGADNPCPDRTSRQGGDSSAENPTQGLVRPPEQSGRDYGRQVSENARRRGEQTTQGQSGRSRAGGRGFGKSVSELARQRRGGPRR